MNWILGDPLLLSCLLWGVCVCVCVRVCVCERESCLLGCVWVGCVWWCVGCVCVYRVWCGVCRVLVCVYVLWCVFMCIVIGGDVGSCRGVCVCVCVCVC